MTFTNWRNSRNYVSADRVQAIWLELGADESNPLPTAILEYAGSCYITQKITTDPEIPEYWTVAGNADILGTRWQCERFIYFSHYVPEHVSFDHDSLSQVWGDFCSAFGLPFISADEIESGDMADPFVANWIQWFRDAWDEMIDRENREYEESN